MATLPWYADYEDFNNEMAELVEKDLIIYCQHVWRVNEDGFYVCMACGEVE